MADRRKTEPGSSIPRKATPPAPDGAPSTEGQSKQVADAAVSGATADDSLPSGDAPDTLDASDSPDSSAGATATATAQRHARGAPRSCPIVGIGASAGGLEAMQRLLDGMPADSGVCIVIVQHLHPTQESHLVEILARHTTMPVRQIEDGMRAEPDHVYIIRPDRELTIRGCVLHLGLAREPRGHRRPIDVFFRSLAADQQERAIGIVLSGTGSDGALGLRDVKARGGIVIAQDPREAQFDGMPRSAINEGLVDFILTVDQMPETILRYAAQPQVKDPRLHEALLDTEEAAFTDILELLRRRSGHEFHRYKRPTLLRRIRRRMSLKFVGDMREYLAVLHDDPDECTVLAGELFIRVTGFFRDPEAWKALEQEVVAPLIRRAEPHETIRAWVAGCSSGEEAYSLAMLLMERAEAEGKSLRVRIFATDPSDSLDVGRAGVYPAAVAADIPQARLDRFFEIDDGAYRVTRRLRDAVTFAPHDLLRDPPFSRLDIITCRNLLIYLEPQMQSSLLALFHFALRPGGHLFLGSAETLGREANLFRVVSSHWRIFNRIGRTRHDRVDLALFGGARSDRQGAAGDLQERTPPAPVAPGAMPAAAAPPRQPNVSTLAERELLRRFAPASILVNEHCRILSVHGQLDGYLALPQGEMTGDLLAMARRGLIAPLRAIIAEALRERAPKRAEARARRGDTLHPVSITAAPLLDPLTGETLALVSFKDRPEPGPPSAAAAAARLEPSGSSARQVEQELRVTRDELQTAIQQLESTNEDYRASSEEMTAVNEELQSTNEELETSREELQSLNEELNSVNAQLHSKIEDLQSANNDLYNLLSATGLATIFLDTGLRIRWFSPAMTAMLNLIPADIGRRIGDLAQNVRGADLEAVARTVLETLVPAEHEVEDQSGRYFLHRTLPYRTKDNRISGAVITLTDITERRQMEQRLRDALHYAEKIVDTVRQPILVLDHELRVASTNAAFCNTFKLDCDDVIGRLVYEVADGDWDIPELRRLLERILPENESLEGFEFTQNFRRLGPRTMLLNACRVDGVQFVLLAIEDVTERRRFQEDQRVLLRELAHRVKNALLTAQTIALQSARQARSLDDFIAGFEGRLSSMAKAYDLLSRRRWEGVDLRQLLDVELTPYCGPGGPRRQLAGPPVHLNAESALALQLVLHELATNAAKYGALSTPAGRLRVRWDTDDSADPTLWLRWAERGGPPVAPPAESGFGSQLVKLTVEYDLRGEYEPTYTPKGFRCEITVPWEKEPREPGSRSIEPEATP